MILLGGSFAEGYCYSSDHDIAGNLIKGGIQTLNLGVATTGPLVSLAVLKEFAQAYKPKNVFYLYYESNSLEVLKWEEKDSRLVKYLDKNHNINYKKNIKMVKKFLDSAEKESLEIAKNKSRLNQKLDSNIKRNYFKNIQDILEINILRNRLRSFFDSSDKKYNLQLLNETIDEMRMETEKWNGNFTFVYVPSWDRFFNNSSNLHRVIKLRKEIIKNLKIQNIEVIDTTNFFSNVNNLSKYYPLGYVGHFNKKGYKKVADILKERILN